MPQAASGGSSHASRTGPVLYLRQQNVVHAPPPPESHSLVSLFSPLSLCAVIFHLFTLVSYGSFILPSGVSHLHSVLYYIVI